MNLTLDQLSLLYELSLTNLNYRDPEDTARKFIKKLLSRKNLRYGAVWRIESGDAQNMNFRRIYSMPKVAELQCIPMNVFTQNFGESELHFTDHSLFAGSEMEGQFVYIKLREFGLLELYDESVSNDWLSTKSFYPLLDVITQFAVSLESGYDYMNLQEEIRQRQIAEALFTASEEKYRRIIDNIQLGLLEVDNDEVIQHANKSFLDLLGYQWHEIEGRKASDVFIGESEKESHEVINKHNALRGEKKSSSYEILLRDKKGNKKWLIISGTPNYDAHHQLIGSIGIHLDITEQKQLEEEVEFKDSRLEKLFQMSLDALITINEGGQIIEWNPQAEKIFGYSYDEVKGKRLSETIIPHQHREAHDQGMQHFNKTGEGPVLNNRIEITALRKGGIEFPIELTIFPIQSKNHHYITAFVRDITEIKKSQQNLERTLQRQKELNNLKSQFIAMTSHELRTPLTTIRSNTELASFQLVNHDDLDRERLQKNISRINDNVDRLNTLINNILIIGQVDSNKVPFNPERVRLIDFVKDRVLPDITQIEKPIKLKIEGEEAPVKIDKKLFWHILSNLLENAIKYSPESEESPELSIDFSSEHMVKIKVQDHGMGIPAEDVKRLFDSFFRASNVGNIQGSGLGLAIVKEFIKLHDGSIEVESKINHGTIFTILIPKAN